MDIAAWANDLTSGLGDFPGGAEQPLGLPVEPPTKVAKVSHLSSDDAPPPEVVSAPGANEDAKKGHWEKVFEAFQNTGQTAKALEYAKTLRFLRETLKEVHGKYKDMLASENELLQNAYVEALEGFKVPEPEPQEPVDQETLEQQAQMTLAYQQAIQLQVQAQQEVEAKAWELRKSIDEAHQFASRTAGDFEDAKVATGIPRPRRRLPQRPGMQPCAFYMRTGDCAYGSGCKWDHPDRGDGKNGPGCFTCGGAHLARECPITAGLPKK